MKDHVALVIRQGSKTLFVQRSLQKTTLPGMWAFASGTVEDGETLQQTAIREAKEELAVDVVPIKVMAVHDLVEMNTRLHFVLCEIKNGTPTIVARSEIEQIAWMNFHTFFETFNDSQIGHGLVWLRTQPKLWQNENL
jgi:ADP-ribose pyrophosphatase YjhB (NUDIX family)